MTFKNFKVLVEKEGSLKQALRTDDGEEYNSHDFAQFYENHGIKHQLTNILYTSTKWCMWEEESHNSKHGVKFFGKEWSSKSIWPEAIDWSIHILNRASIFKSIITIFLKAIKLVLM